MGLSDDVYGQLKATGETLKNDLWQPDDLKTLKLIAIDLAGLNAKMLLAKDDDTRTRYAQAAMRLIDHSALLALSRLNVAMNDIWTMLKNFFLKLVGQWQPQVLPALGNLIPGIGPTGTGTSSSTSGAGTTATTPTTTSSKDTTATDAAATAASVAASTTKTTSGPDQGPAPSGDDALPWPKS